MNAVYLLLLLIGLNWIEFCNSELESNEEQCSANDDRSICSPLRITFPIKGEVYMLNNIQVDIIVDKTMFEAASYLEMTIEGVDGRQTRKVSAIEHLTIDKHPNRLWIPFAFGIDVSEGFSEPTEMKFKISLWSQKDEKMSMLSSDATEITLRNVQSNVRLTEGASGFCGVYHNKSLVIDVTSVEDMMHYMPGTVFIVQGETFGGSSGTILSLVELNNSTIHHDASTNTTTLRLNITLERSEIDELRILVLSPESVGARRGRQLLRFMHVKTHELCRTSAQSHRAVDVTNWRHGSYFLYPVEDTYVGKSVHKYGEWSHGELKFFELLLSLEQNSKRVFLDVGSNIGAFSIPISQSLGPDGLVLAFEGSEATYNILCGNVALRNTPMKAAPIHAFNSILGEKDAIGRVDVAAHGDSPKNIGAQSFVRFSESAGEGPIQKMTKLDTILEEHFPDLERISLVKVDVEGMELRVLKGFAKQIQKHRPILFLEADRMEYHYDLVKYLEDDLKYIVYWRIDPLFNKDNFKQEQRNEFPDVVSINVVAFPTEKFEVYKDKLQGHLGNQVKRDSVDFEFMQLGSHLAVSSLLNMHLNNTAFRASSVNGEDGVFFALFHLFGTRGGRFVDFSVKNANLGSNSVFWKNLYGMEAVVVPQSEVSSYRDTVPALRKHEVSHSEEVISFYDRLENIYHMCEVLCGVGKCDAKRLVCDYPEAGRSQDYTTREFAPRFISFRVNSVMFPDEPYASPPDFDGESYCGGANIHAFVLLAKSAGYTVMYCEENGDTCFAVRDSVMHTSLFRDKTREFVDSRTTPSKLYKPIRKLGYPQWTVNARQLDAEKCTNVFKAR